MKTHTHTHTHTHTGVGKWGSAAHRAAGRADFSVTHAPDTCACCFSIVFPDNGDGSACDPPACTWSAHLSADGQILTFDVGIVWNKLPDPPTAVTR